MIGGIDFVDLNTGDAEYWDVYIEKVLRGAVRNNKDRKRFTGAEAGVARVHL